MTRAESRVRGRAELRVSGGIRRREGHRESIGVYKAKQSTGLPKRSAKTPCVPCAGRVQCTPREHVCPLWLAVQNCRSPCQLTTGGHNHLTPGGHSQLTAGGNSRLTATTLWLAGAESLWLSLSLRSPCHLTTGGHNHLTAGGRSQLTAHLQNLGAHTSPRDSAGAPQSAHRRYTAGSPSACCTALPCSVACVRCTFEWAGARGWGDCQSGIVKWVGALRGARAREDEQELWAAVGPGGLHDVG